MKKKLLLTGLLVFLCLLRGYSQQNLPVAGNAAKLIDLLKKDYNTVDPDSRDADITRDRAEVISIFRSYLTNEMVTGLEKALDSVEIALFSSLQSSSETYAVRKRAIDAAVTNNKPITTAEITDLSNAKTDLRKAQYKLDTTMLYKLKLRYHLANPFLKVMVALFRQKYDAIYKNSLDPYAATGQSTAVNKGILSPGTDLSFSVYIDALAKFLAKRIKEELAIYVMEKVKYQLTNPKADDPFAEFKVLLPATTRYLANFRSDQVLNFQKNLRQFIEDDLNHVIDHAPNLATTPRFKALLRQYPDMAFAFEALSIIPQFKNIKYPVDYFTVLENNRLINTWKDDEAPLKHNIANVVRLSSLLAHSLQVIDNSEPHFAGTEFLANYGSQENFYKLFIGFLYQQNIKYYDINFVVKPKTPIAITNDKGGVTTASTDKINYHLEAGLMSLMTTTNDATDQLRADREIIMGMYSQVTNEIEQVDAMATVIKQANKLGQKIGADTLHAYIESMADVTEQTLGTADTLMKFLLNKAKLLNHKFSAIQITHIGNVYTYTPANSQESKKGEEAMERINLVASAKPYITIVRGLNDVTYELRKANYGSGLTKALDLYQSLVPKTEVNNVIESITRLSNIRRDSKMEQWKVIYRLIDSMKIGKARTISNDIKKACVLLEGELYNLDNYYKDTRGNDDITALQTNIEILIGLLQEAESGTATIDAEKKDALKSLRKDPDFKLLVISYYSNLGIKKLIGDLSVQMTNLRRPNMPDNKSRVFTDKQVEQMVKMIEEYALQLYQTFIVDGKKDMGEANYELRASLLSLLTNYIATLPHTNASLPDEVVKLLGFVNDVAQANDADGLSKALDDFALPTGSYTIKRTQIFNISINAFPGFLPAWEFTSTDAGYKKAFSIGFTAPVGLSFAWASHKGTSNGFFVPIIDIGAVTRLRLDNDRNAEALPEFTFRNVFAPGIFYHHGFAKAPLSVNVGIQYGPQLREIQPDKTIKSYDSFRLGAGVVLDIPLFNLHTTPRD
jgi:hypothetical protein